MDDLSGQEIRGYVLRERIGVGGFGAVYRATQSSVEREVAVKIILPQFASQPDFKRRFEGEARLIARLEHVHIVPLFDYWQEADGSAYLVMRWLRGGSLRRLIRESPLELVLAARIMDQTAQALAIAHEKGIIHRDLKPDNILLDEYENAYLSDFGIAKDNVSSSNITMSGNTPGTPAYAAPEQLTGQPVAPQTDIYSLGITLYEALAGQHPFPKSPIQHLRDNLPPILRPDVPYGVNDVIARSTAKDPLERYASTMEFAAALRHALVPATTSIEFLTRPEGQPYSVETPFTPPRRTSQHVVSDPHKTTEGNRELIPTRTDAPGAQSALVIAHANDVPGRPDKLIGRDEVVAEVEALLDKGQRVLLQGMGGMGKTTLAAEIAARRIEADQRPVLWLRAGTEKAPALLEALVRPFDSTSIDASVVRQLITDAGVKLIVLDDVWEGAVLKQVIDALPRGLPVLVTSRQRYPLNKIIDIGELELNTALELLSFHAAQDYTSADTDAVTLCRLVGFHPFTLEIAGKTLLVDELTPGDLLRRVDDTPHLMKMPEGFAEDGRESVQKLLDDSTSSLDPFTLRMFLAFGALHVPEATVELLTLIMQTDSAKAEEALTGLARRGLAKRQTGCMLPMYRIHDLAFSYARANVALKRQVVIAGYLEYITHHKDTPGAIDLERTNALKTAGTAYQTDDSASLIKLLYVLTVEGSYFRARGHDSLLLEQLDHAIEAARTTGDQKSLHYFLGKRGDAFYDRGGREHALLRYEESLHLARSLNLPNRVVILLCVISKVHADQKAFEAAEADL
ncbi:MAG: protein kinase, partial [Chloroflexota bacterium]